jgi:hypothetical protein
MAALKASLIWTDDDEAHGRAWRITMPGGRNGTDVVVRVDDGGVAAVAVHKATTSKGAWSAVKAEPTTALYWNQT